MVTITAVLLVRQSRFDSSTLLRSLAYSVALSVRQAQIYGTSVVGTTTVSSANCTGGSSYVGGGCYASAYGIHFVAPEPSSSYTLFADLNGNGKYDPGEDVKAFNLSLGYTVSNVCVLAGSVLDCSAPSCPTSAQLALLPFAVSSCTPSFFTAFVDIVFRRPNPDACFATDAQPGSCQAGASSAYPDAYIQISNGDNTRSIIISSTGQISVGVAGS